MWIDFTNKLYFPLTYPPSFLDGPAGGWHRNRRSTSGKKVLLLQWALQLFMREPRFHQLGALTNEFLVDVFSCI